jgi:cytochrome c biogenesis protein CcmG, thiol:disulfide interchange protein DsbE
MRAWRFVLPLTVFAVVVLFLWKGLSLDPREIPSPLIEKAVPAFTLPQLHAPDKTLSAAELKGQVWLLNVWGSWCVSCRVEHPFLMQLARSGDVPIYGLDWKASDVAGRTAIDFGVYGAPETFVIDKQGVIRYKQIGPVTPEALRDTILPLVKKLQQ